MPRLNKSRPIRPRCSPNLLSQWQTWVFFTNKGIQALGEKVTKLFTASTIGACIRVILKLPRLPYARQLTGGSLVRKKKPVLAIYVCEKGQRKVVAVHA